MKIKGSVYKHFLKTLLPLCISVFIVLIGVFEWSNFQASQKKLQAKLANLSSVYSLILADSIIKKDNNALGLFSVSLISDPDIAGLKITDSEKNVLEVYGNVYPEKKYLTITRRINAADESGYKLLGFFTLIVTEDNIFATLKRRVYYELLLLFALILIVLVGTKRAYKVAIGKPLNQLTKAINYYDETSVHNDISNNANNELSLVIDAYNTMQNSRIVIAKKLIDSHSQLGLKVEQRTQELTTETLRHKKTSDLLFEAQQRVSVILNTITDAVISTDLSGIITYSNASAQLMFEQLQHQLLAKKIETVLSLKSIETDELLSPIMGLVDNSPLGSFKLEAKFNTPSEKEYYLELLCNVLTNSDNKKIGYSFIIRDITDSWKHAKKLSYLASHDALTGLLNRREFERLLGLSVIDADTFDTSHALCFIDLDNFKSVNDNNGHLAGDELLKKVAFEFKKLLRKGDYLTRLGGDEFSVLLMNCPTENAMLIMEKMRIAIENIDFEWDGSTISIGISAGVTSIYSGCGTSEDVLSRADSSCYISKKSGRNQVHLFHEDKLNPTFGD